MRVYIVILYPLPKIYLWTLKSIMKKSFVLLLLTIISISSQSTNRYSLLVVTIQDDNKTLFSIDSGEDLCQSTNKNPEHRYCWRTEDRRNRKCLSNGEGVLRQKSKETREATPYDRSFTDLKFFAAAWARRYFSSNRNKKHLRNDWNVLVCLTHRMPPLKK